jgi:hypothetical protein
MPLLSSPQAKSVGAGALALALVGLVTAAITHSEDLVRAWDYVAGNPETRLAAGHWRGVYKEFDPKGNEIIGHETVQLEAGGIASGNGGVITPTSGTERLHKLKWTLKDSYFLATYQDKWDDRIGAVVYVLKGQPTSALEGFWTGYDVEKNGIVSCPYVMARGQSVEQMKTTFAARLAKNCTY